MDLPPDLLREISGRLPYAADYVRFHAVCRPWRDSHSRDVLVSRANRFPPWLLASNDKETICVFSKMSYHASLSAKKRNWVANADGTAVRYFTAGPCCGLHDPLTGGATLALRPIPHQSYPWELILNPNGIIYGDGTILLFCKSSGNRFSAALLRPGDVAWTLVERNLQFTYGEFCVVYHGGKIMVTVEASEWRVITTNDVVEDDVLVPMTWMPTDYFYHYSYALETRGELLWVSIQIDWARHQEDRSSVGGLSLFVHALQEGTEGAEKLRWVRKDGRSLADRVIFLGWPNSFAVDASGRLGDDGGCVYFIYENREVLTHEQFEYGVFRYSLVDEKAVLVQWLPIGWRDEWCAWLVPQLAIAPIPVH